MMYANYDAHLKSLIAEVLNDGTEREVRATWADGTRAKTKAVFGAVMGYDLSRGAQIPSIVPVPIKMCIDEILWIWQKKSNVVADLINTKIWSPWMLDDGTIGKAYGGQLAVKHNLGGKTQDVVDYTLNTLRSDPFSRRMVINMFTTADLSEMALPPCAHSLTLNVTEGIDGLILNGILNQRSQDIMVANAWNVFQYSMLISLMAKEVGMHAGKLIHVIADAHIYDRHYDAAYEVLDRVISAPNYAHWGSKVSYYSATPNDVKKVEELRQCKYKYLNLELAI